MEAGSVRDDTIVELAGYWREFGADEEALIESISDNNKRGQARVRHVYSLMGKDLSRARELLQHPDIPEYQRQQIEARIIQYQGRM